VSPTVAVVRLHGLGRSPRDWDGVAPGLRTFGPVVAPQLPLDRSAATHVPVDFALAAVKRCPTSRLRVLERGGHHAHVTRPRDWLEAVGPWIGGLAPGRP
jgi:pimeloyl-ACP methyl ester carboxylesterase